MRNLSRELLLALSKTFKSERFAALSATVTNNKLPDRIDFCQAVSVSYIAKSYTAVAVSFSTFFGSERS